MDRLKKVGEAPDLSPMTTEKDIHQYTKPIPYPVARQQYPQHLFNICGLSTQI